MLRCLFLLLICISLVTSPVFAEIYSFPGTENGAEPLNDSVSGSTTNVQQKYQQSILRIEYLNQQLELAKIEFDNQFAVLAKAPADEYNQAVQDVLALKFDIIDLNEELIELTTKDRQSSEIRLQRLYAWSDKIDLLLEKDRLKNGPQARSSRLEVLTLSVEEVKRGIDSITYSIKVDIDNPGERGLAAVKVAGIGVEGHIIESKTLKGQIGQEELKTLYDMIIVAPEHALHIIDWEVVKTAIQ